MQCLVYVVNQIFHVLDVEGENGTGIIRQVLLPEVIVFIGFEPWIIDPGHKGMLFQELGDGKGSALRSSSPYCARKIS